MVLETKNHFKTIDSNGDFPSNIHSFNGNGEYKNVLFTPSQSSKAQTVYKINCSLHNEK